MLKNRWYHFIKTWHIVILIPNIDRVWKCAKSVYIFLFYFFFRTSSTKVRNIYKMSIIYKEKGVPPWSPNSVIFWLILSKTKKGQYSSISYSISPKKISNMLIIALMKCAINQHKNFYLYLYQSKILPEDVKRYRLVPPL